MKFAWASIVAIVLSTTACGGGMPPTAPTPPSPPVPSNPPTPSPPAPAPPAPTPGLTGDLWVVVLPEGDSGLCITGATVEVVVQSTVVQSKTQQPCDYWDPDYDLFFKDLPIEGVTVRASASGYVAREVPAFPSTGWQPATAIFLKRAN